MLIVVNSFFSVFEIAISGYGLFYFIHNDEGGGGLWIASSFHSSK